AIPTRNALARISFRISSAPEFRCLSVQSTHPHRHIKAHRKRCPQVSAGPATRQAFSHQIFNRHQSKKLGPTFFVDVPAVLLGDGFWEVLREKWSGASSPRSISKRQMCVASF